ncbi:22466_t:CDS:2 [Entrophospora sp. SA101]|nr:22466_t:CDS:2 [Entrophospora sp. SA101]
MLKHLNPDTIEILLSLFNRCISTSHIPSAWKHANVYPIPKPKEWHYQLTHTCPITLLECTQLGYTINTTLPSNLTVSSYTTNAESVTITNVAYMDDTTWIASSKEKMYKILSIASSFYQLNAIKVNPDKSTLMVINSSGNDNETNATFNNISIHSTPTNTPVRILGVWFNTSGSQKHHISSFKNAINTFKSLLYPKN